VLAEGRRGLAVSVPVPHLRDGIWDSITIRQQLLLFMLSEINIIKNIIKQR
jgi:hypothetical protein